VNQQQQIMPFAALIGQEKIKLALLMLGVNPRLNGVLLRGEKGTAKSTAARGLASLLPSIEVNQGCHFGCRSNRPGTWCAECQRRSERTVVECRPPFATLPLGITEDQLLGTIDLERALQRGEQRFKPGLLARVNHGVLYVDEINLLDDHIVDLLLDSAAMGVNVVEREGVSASHPADFLLVGTMNPEEGVLRPQLLDRFGLCVEVTASRDAAERAEIIDRCLSFERDPVGFTQAHAETEAALSEQIRQARELLPAVEVDPSWLTTVAELSLALGVDGHRADILMIKAAQTLAALDGRTAIHTEDIDVAAEVVYAHRLRRRPFDDQAQGDESFRETVREVVDRREKKKEPHGEVQRPTRRSDPRMMRPVSNNNAAGTTRSAEQESCPDVIGLPSLFRTDVWVEEHDDQPELATGDRPADVNVVRETEQRTPAFGRGRRFRRTERPFRGHFLRATPSRGAMVDVAWADTMRAAAPYQTTRSDNGLAIQIHPSEVRRKVRVSAPGRLWLLVVDISGSMGGRQMKLAKEIAVRLLRNTYVQREEVAMIAFRERRAALLLAPGNQAERAGETLRGLTCGGTTPLEEGLRMATSVLRKQQSRHPNRPAALLLISDGDANVGSGRGHGGVVQGVHAVAASLAGQSALHRIFLDTTPDGKNDFAARQLAEKLNADRLSLARFAPKAANRTDEITNWLLNRTLATAGIRA
jgi:magnesium chelatase subunit D